MDYGTLKEIRAFVTLKTSTSYCESGKIPLIELFELYDNVVKLLEAQVKAMSGKQ